MWRIQRFGKRFDAGTGTETRTTFPFARNTKFSTVHECGQFRPNEGYWTFFQYFLFRMHVTALRRGVQTPFMQWFTQFLGGRTNDETHYMRYNNDVVPRTYPPRQQPPSQNEKLHCKSTFWPDFSIILYFSRCVHLPWRASHGGATDRCLHVKDWCRFWRNCRCAHSWFWSQVVVERNGPSGSFQLRLWSRRGPRLRQRNVFPSFSHGFNLSAALFLKHFQAIQKRSSTQTRTWPSWNNLCFLLFIKNILDFARN